MKKILLIVFALILSGCYGVRPQICNQEQIDAQALQKINEKNRAIAKRFVSQLPKHSFILVTTVSDVDNLDQSERTQTLGRFVTEDVISALSENGAKVVEIKLRKKILSVKNSGEFALSHELKNLMKKYSADYLVTGTYTVGSDRIYINLKLIDFRNHIVSASSSYFVAIDNDIRKLLGLKQVEPMYCEDF